VAPCQRPQKRRKIGTLCKKDAVFLFV
jgi:hypothetical protein